MRHRKKGRKLRKSRSQQKALFYGLASSLILKEKIITTEIKAKELRPLLEKSITRAKKNTIFDHRFLSKNFEAKIVKKLFHELVPRYKDISGGYTRIIKIGPRKSDGAKMAIIELTK